MEFKDRRAKDATQVLLALEQAGYAARLAGGCVRDRLMGVQPMDFDVATDALPEACIAVFRAQGYKVVPTGIEHGTVTMVAPSGPIEITSLRQDVATDGRRAKVVFGKSFEEDAERRDFTINAMFEDARGLIYDFHRGQDDLQQKCLRFVGHPETRIQEDYLRVLRLFRFWSKLGFAPVPGTLEAVTKQKHGLKEISQERITGELLKILAGDFAGGPLQAMHQVGVWDLVLPEFTSLRSGSKTVGKSLPLSLWPLPAVVPEGQKGIAGLAMACLLEWEHSSEKDWASLGIRLRLSRAEIKAFAYFPAFIEHLKNLGPEVADALLLADACDHAGGTQALCVLYAPIIKAIASKITNSKIQGLIPALDTCLRMEHLHGHRRRNSPPLTGKDLMAHFLLMQGPLLGEALTFAKRGYLNGAWSTRDEGLLYMEGMPELALRKPCIP